MSKFQKRIRRLLIQVLGNVPIQAEVNVSKLFPFYEARNQHYDLVIPQYDLIVECHGEQHRSIQSFGGKKDENLVGTLMLQKRRDRRKEEVARENDWAYLVIWHDDLNKDDAKAALKLKEMITTAFEEE